MASVADLTIEALSELRLSEISKEWVDQVWQSDFCEHCELPDVLLEDIIIRKYFGDALKGVLKLIRQWSECVPGEQPLGNFVCLCLLYNALSRQ